MFTKRCSSSGRTIEQLPLRTERSTGCHTEELDLPGRHIPGEIRLDTLGERFLERDSWSDSPRAIEMQMDKSRCC